MNNVTYSGNSQEREEETFTLPKNIRQIGEGGKNKKIYLEDYAVTYMLQLAKDKTEKKGALLLGEKEQKENVWYFFVNSVLELSDIRFEEEDWKEIKEQAAQFFCGREILGWFLYVPEDDPISGDEVSCIHLNQFGENDKLLIISSQEETDLELYLTEAGNLAMQPGYYIYYEKNEQMQDYMVSRNEGHSIEKEIVVTDKAIQNFRKIAEEKRESVPNVGFTRFLYGACTFLIMTVLVLGVTTINNYDKMKNLEVALDTLKGENDLQQASGKVKTETENISLAGIEDKTVKKGDDLAEVLNGGDVKADGKNADKSEQKITEVSTEQAESSDTAKSNETQKSGENDAEASQSSEKTAEEPKQKSGTNAETESKGAKEQTETSKTNGGNKEATADAQSSSDGKKDDEVLPAMAGLEDQNANRASYTVKNGDTLANICKMYYGNLQKLEEICSINNIEDENKILPGQKIYLP
ncbi:LysM peptidoglycan-binding domain-containing protein [Murimonas intestini]|uniref:LysM domain-containing protein n=1 Tax=Murimonas intestini TaxID=1337051 RepID=A0AB73SXC5_9FIRM|nr:LysM peptidoglycan-binding domain-containing protein [Murimonas intestini]MCR1843476.1 LysM peptidoglycan-binding domain-containing protein [Murimonas intestini]MCR1868809.1 LysM peptidoglycan-binding domain-containing protein [Murimonas intestini]MCR1886405.1 LysM peptidoglycan-binding domain-containing protein [Murimonas intestini]